MRALSRSCSIPDYDAGSSQDLNPEVSVDQGRLSLLMHSRSPLCSSGNDKYLSSAGTHAPLCRQTVARRGHQIPTYVGISRAAVKAIEPSKFAKLSHAKVLIRVKPLNLL